MPRACYPHATSTLQVQEVDEELHVAVRERAAGQGLTIGQYLLELIRKDLQRPTRSAWLQQVKSLPGVRLDPGEIVASIDEGRAERDHA